MIGQVIQAPAEQESDQLRRRIQELGPWFHNLRLGGEQTAPDHFLGDYPAVKWRNIEPAIPQDLDGATVLDIGCNAGFYSIQMKNRGASRVLGIDTDDTYLNQARFANEMLGLDIEFRKCSTYDVDTIDEQFDIVLFMGLLYHLRYPLYALDKVVQKVRGVLVFQTMIRPSVPAPAVQVEEDYDFWQEDMFEERGFPRMHFIEKSYSHDCTNWWVPNTACAEAMLRSAGLELFCHPEPETWFCAPKHVKRRGEYVQDLEFQGQLW